MKNLCLLVNYLLILSLLTRVESTKRRHKENTTSVTYIDASDITYGEIIGVAVPVDYDLLEEDDPKNEFVYSRLHLYYYNSDGDVTYKGKINEADDLYAAGCHPSQKLTVLVHGWTQSCEVQMMRVLAQKYKQHRGGCVTCFDYAPYAADPNYFRLVRHFRMLRDTLTEKLNILNAQGFHFGNSHAWGFSYGGRLILRALERINGKYRSVDVCDMAGPGFDNRLRNKCDYRAAAENVQCIYTSRNRGTRCTTGCHQNWLMGHCGEFQDGAGGVRTKSHSLCPIFYIEAFDLPFYAQQTNECALTEPAIWPEGYRMGYMEGDKSVRGQITCPTSRNPPYSNIYNTLSIQTTKITPISDNETIVELTEEEEWYGTTTIEPDYDSYDTTTDNIEYIYEDDSNNDVIAEQQPKENPIKTTIMIT